MVELEGSGNLVDIGVGRDGPPELGILLRPSFIGLVLVGYRFLVGARFLQRFCAEAGGRPKAQALFDRWLGIALLSFGRPGTAGNASAIEAGLKGRDSGEVMKEFLEDIKPTMRACGLAFPPREAVGVELPPDVAWRL